MRSFADAPEASEKYDDWTTTEVSFVTTRPLSLTPVPHGGPPAPLAPGVTLEPHAELRAKARLVTLPQATRDLGHIDVPAVLKDDPDVSWPLLFSPTRGGDPGLQVLELTEVTDYEAVTPERPLRLNVEVPLGDDEAVLPVSFDGEFFLPLGYAESADPHGLTVTLERLPHPVARLERSLAGSVRIFFQKVLSRSFSIRYDYPLLAIPTVTDDRKVNYEQDLAKVHTRVAQAARILLFIHGITGDSRSMAACVPSFTPPVAGYDLVLTFDYENLNTNLEVVAAGLSDRLRQAGLGPDHGKTLDVVAHSMGGLVARWFIERMKGNRVVRRLVMLGTPNAGSPWPTVCQWGTFLLTVGLNSLAPTAWTAKALSRLVPLLRPLTLDLGQMKPGSDFLRALADSPDPCVPYLLVAGDTSKGDGFGDAEQKRLQRLLTLLTTRKILYTLADPFFLNSANDVAVSVESMASVPHGRGHELETMVVACDHMSYFTSSAGLKALEQLLRG
jgi:pimeloyl-ACP methyl ester carboxylesterase